MPQYKNLDETYDHCVAEGYFKLQEDIDHQKLQSMLQLSNIFADTADDLKKNLDHQSPKWSVVYILYYDALRELAEIMTLLDKTKIVSHQCLFAYLCTKHPELELDWNFFEKVRTKRNGVHYYGTLLSFIDWKEIELQLKLYISTLKKAVKEKIKI